MARILIDHCEIIRIVLVVCPVRTETCYGTSDYGRIPERASSPRSVRRTTRSQIQEVVIAVENVDLDFLVNG